MKNFKVNKVHFKQSLSFCFLFLLYTVVGDIWLAVLYTHDKWLNLGGIILISVFLVLLYTFINSRLSLGIWKYIFVIPIFPNLIGTMLLQPIEFSIFPNPYTKDDLGIGLLAIMIAFPNWIAMMLSFLLAHKMRERRNHN